MVVVKRKLNGRDDAGAVGIITDYSNLRQYRRFLTGRLNFECWKF